MKRITALILTFILVFTFAGCGGTEAPDTQENAPSDADGVTDSVADSVTSSDTVNNEDALTVCIDTLVYELELKGVFEAFEQEHPEIPLNFEFIPAPSSKDNDAERRGAIDRIRTSLMAGRGADIYFVNTALAGTVTSTLFTDTNLAMESGVFCDAIPLLESVDVHMDEFVEPVMKAGQIDGKQYIVPLNYKLNVILTTDTTRELMGGDEAFKTAGSTIEGLLKMSQISNSFSKTLNGISMEGRTITSFFNPFYLSGDPIVDYSSHTASIDSQFVRDVLTNAVVINSNIADRYNNKGSQVSAPSEETQKEWEAYVKSDGYVRLDNLYGQMMQEAGYLEHMGVTPHVDVFPSEDGGGHAEISSFAAVRANSKYSSEAAELLKYFLSEQNQVRGNHSTVYWPVRKGLLPQIMDKFVNSSVSVPSLYYPNSYYEAPLSDAVKEQFCAIEDGITLAVFRPPVEVNSVLNEYYNGERDLGSAIDEMQQYYEMSLWAAD